MGSCWLRVMVLVEKYTHVKRGDFVEPGRDLLDVTYGHDSTYNIAPVYTLNNAHGDRGFVSSHIYPRPDPLAAVLQQIEPATDVQLMRNQQTAALGGISRETLLTEIERLVAQPDESCGWLIEAVGTVLHLRGGSNPAAMHPGLSNLCSNYSNTLVQLCGYMQESMDELARARLSDLNPVEIEALGRLFENGQENPICEQKWPALAAFGRYVEGRFGFMSAVRTGAANQESPGVGGLSLTVRALGSCYSGRPIGAPGGATPAADGHRVQELEWNISLEVDPTTTVAQLKQIIADHEPQFAVCAIRLSVMGVALGFSPSDRVYNQDADKATLAQSGVLNGDVITLGLACAPLAKSKIIQ